MAPDYPVESDENCTTTSHHQHLLSQQQQSVGTDYISPSSAVRVCGIYIKADVSMRSHVAKTVSACFAVLRQLQRIRRSMDRPGQWTDPFFSCCCISHAVSAGLRKCDPGWHSFLPSAAASVCDECRHSADRLHIKVRACHSAAQPTPLAQRPTAEDPSLLTVISHTTVNCPRSDWSLWILQSVRSFLHSFTYVSIVG